MHRILFAAALGIWTSGALAQTGGAPSAGSQSSPGAAAPGPARATTPTATVPGASPATSQTAPPSRLLPSPAPSATASTPSGVASTTPPTGTASPAAPAAPRSQPASHSLRWRYRLGPADRKKPNHRALCRLREALGQPHSHEQDGVVAHLPAYRESTAEPSRRKHGSRRLRPQAPSHRKIARQRLAAGRLLRFPPRAGLDRARLPSVARQSAAVCKPKKRAEGPARQSGQEGAALSASAAAFRAHRDEDFVMTRNRSAEPGLNT